jgi:Eco29kI restriction endonuclease
MPHPLFNPLDKANLGKSIVDALLSRPAQPLAALERFDGAGVYAVYYHGSFAPYLPAAALPHCPPLYVGKAVPKGGRKGLASDAAAHGTSLSDRLLEHADSIQQSPTLKLADFTCRSLVVDDIWIPLGETLLIQRYEPLWNVVVEGFGNHDPGTGRYKGQRPLWDELHPGRAWAAKCAPAKLKRDAILKLVAAHWAARKG